MKKYIVYKNTGEIIRYGVCQDETFNLQSQEGELILEGECTGKYQYIDAYAVVDMPDKPEGDYEFDYISKQWKYNIDLAKIKAINKRDILLSEGPDRISPMWWSSMTPEEQQAWSDYRQALLDITSQPNYPETIVWPTKP